MKKECIAMLLAGGQGSRLYVLTGDMAKPAVPFGGKYRIIDFPLSNCTNSGIDTVGVLTQYRPLELNSYIGSGVPWDLDGSTAASTSCLPTWAARAAPGTRARPTPSIRTSASSTCMIGVCGGPLRRPHLQDGLLRHGGAPQGRRRRLHHLRHGGALGRCAPLRHHERGRGGHDHRVRGEAQSPRATWPPWASMSSPGRVLRKYLEADEADPHSENDFGKNVIPAMLRDGQRMAAYRFSGYWKDVGTLESLWDANMDMLSPESGLDLLDESWPIYARSVKRAAGLPGQAQPDEPQRLQPRQHHRGGGGELRSLPQCHRGRGRAGGLFRALPRRDGGARRRGGVCHPGRGLPHRQKLPVGGTPETTAPAPWGLAVLAPGCTLEDERQVRPGVMLGKNGEEVSR